MDVKDLLGKFIKEMADEGMSFILQQTNHPGFFMKVYDEETLQYSSYECGKALSDGKFSTLKLRVLRDFQVAKVELPSRTLQRRVGRSSSSTMDQKESYVIIHVR